MRPLIDYFLEKKKKKKKKCFFNQAISFKPYSRKELKGKKKKKKKKKKCNFTKGSFRE